MNFDAMLADRSRRLPRALVVAGPSGSGKSTLIDQLVAGRLPEDMRSALPDDVADWPVLQGKRLRKLGRDGTGALPANLANGLIAHYDTTYVIRAGLRRYEQDHAAEFFRQFASLIIVSIEPTVDQLRQQLDRRTTGRAQTQKRAHRLWAGVVREPLMRAIRRVQGKAEVDPLDVYRDPALVESAYAAWHRYVRSLTAGKDAIILTVEPAQGGEEYPAFRLVSMRMDTAEARP
jgi:GTPase SAR1 family protein